MRDLEQDETYSDVYFNVVPASETARQQEALLALGFANLKHGLIAYDAQGRVAKSLPGHQFGREEVKQALDAIRP